MVVVVDVAAVFFFDDRTPLLLNNDLRLALVLKCNEFDESDDDDEFFLKLTDGWRNGTEKEKNENKQKNCRIKFIEMD